jgi:outer membrane murein-binding lipoprotein Lpp
MVSGSIGSIWALPAWLTFNKSSLRLGYHSFSGLVGIVTDAGNIKEKIMKTAVALLVITAFLMMPPGLFAQQGQSMNTPASGQAAAPAQEASKAKMKEHHETMRAEHEKMMKDMDARLDAKIAAMDAAKGEQKIDAMEAVIKEMVAQRKEMLGHMMNMREHWKHHCKGRKDGTGK